MIEWRSVVGYEGLYSVSTDGQIRRDAGGRGARVGRILKPSIANGYWFVSVHRERSGVATKLYLHVAVAQAFLGTCPVGKEVNHRDGNKLNPVRSNLEYRTRLGNMEHAVRHGLTAHGTRNAHAKLNPKKVREIRALAATLSAHQLATRYRVAIPTVRDIIDRRTWRRIV